ncbi:phage tail tape measure C-terminal domain-containing protein [Henriciella aquimarina]|uniref:phage tail tape measure C-terminal domain-containing protein n=1 Tax=Henriciella aquimarina TaxID=545261 RepID=UPI000A01B2AC|nr:phage tail tape measure C-terminal domain-containing protein [Henriciella aquimarina]
MDEFEDSLARAGDAVGALAEGPGAQAARSLEEAFGRAGQSIESALTKAARSGELDFSRMAQSVLADLARIAAEAALAKSGVAQAGQAFTLNMSVGRGADASQIVGARGELARAVTRAVALGGRFQ